MLKGENTADCAFATKGRPAMMCGFQSGMSGSRSRVQRANGMKTSLWSAISKLLPSGGTSAGCDVVQGVALQSESDGDSVHPGRRPWPTMRTDSTAYMAAA